MAGRLCAQQIWAALALAGLTGIVSACGELGRVEQGIAVDYDAARGVVTLILDSSRGKGEPTYDVVPPVEIRLPEDPRQMGPAPVTGKLVGVNARDCSLRYYEARTQQITQVKCGIRERIFPVYPDDARLRRSSLPAVDRGRGTVTLYSPKDRAIFTVELPGEYLSLPADTWRFGDEMRYYFKQPGQALRMMNVTRTRIS